jgi:protein AATF/BFR2
MLGTSTAAIRTCLVFNSYGRPSSLRKLHDSLNDPKYAGRKITRALGEVPESSESEDENSEPVEHESHGPNSPEASKEDQSMGEQETEETSEEEEERPIAKSKTEEGERKATEDVSSSLKRMRDADRRKGQAVTRQMVREPFTNSQTR